MGCGVPSTVVGRDGAPSLNKIPPYIFLRSLPHRRREKFHCGLYFDGDVGMEYEYCHYWYHHHSVLLSRQPKNEVGWGV